VTTSKKYLNLNYLEEYFMKIYVKSRGFFFFIVTMNSWIFWSIEVWYLTYIKRRWLSVRNRNGRYWRRT